MRFNEFVNEAKKDAKDREIGTDSLVKSLKDDTPGESVSEGVYTNTYGGRRATQLRNRMGQKKPSTAGKYKVKLHFWDGTSHEHEVHAKSRGDAYAQGHTKSATRGMPKGGVKKHTISQIGEDVQIDEISKETHGRYQKKARQDRRDKSLMGDTHARMAGSIDDKDARASLHKDAKRYFKKAQNRMDGIKRSSRLTTNKFYKGRATSEEVEQVDELSVKKLDQYTQKAQNHWTHYNAVSKHAQTKDERDYGEKMRKRRNKGMTRAYDKIDKRQRPDRPTDTNPRIAATEETQVSEMKTGGNYSYKHVMNKINSGDWEANQDVEKGKHVELRHHTGKRVTVQVEEHEKGDTVYHAKTGKPGRVDDVYHWSSGKKSYMVRWKGGRRSKEHFARELVKEEQIDELSKDTLKNYIRKSKHDEEKRDWAAFHQRDPDTKRRLIKKNKQRRQGQLDALDRVMNMEETQIDELSKDTLLRYAYKAGDDADATMKKGVNVNDNGPKGSYRRYGKRVKGAARAWRKYEKKRKQDMREDAPTTSTPGIAAIGGPNDSGEPGLSKKKQREYTKGNARLRKTANTTNRSPSFVNFKRVIDSIVNSNGD